MTIVTGNVEDDDDVTSEGNEPTGGLGKKLSASTKRIASTLDGIGSLRSNLYEI